MAARVLIPDGCPATLRSLTDVLSTLRGVEVVGEAASEEETLCLATRLRPDFIVLDPGLCAGAPIPQRDGELGKDRVPEPQGALPGLTP